MTTRAVTWYVAAAVVAGRIVQATRSSVYGDDLRVFWQAGHLALHHGDPWVRGFDYLPASLALFAPLGALPFDLARAVWTAGSVLTLVACALWTARRTGLPAPLVVAVLFAVFPAASALEFANATVLELPFLLGLAAAVDAGRWRRAAALAVLAVALKPLLVPCLLVFAVRRKTRHLAGVVGALVALDAVALLVAGHASAYLHQLRDSLTAAGDDPRSADIGALVARGDVPPAVALVLGAAAVLTAAAVVLRSSRTSAVLAAPLAASFLVGPVCWAHYPLLLVPVALELRSPPAVAGLALLTAPEVLHGGLLTAVPPAGLFAIITAGVAALLVAMCTDVVPGRSTRRSARLPA